MLVIAYDHGAAAAAEIATALAADTPLAFLVPRSDHTVQVRPLLEQLGTVVDLAGDDRDVARVRALRPDGIVTYSEPMLRDTARIADALGLPGHRPETVLLLTDKERQRRRLAQAGVDAVRHHPVHRPEDWAAALDAVGLPAIVKPLYGGGSRDTHLVRDEETLARLAVRHPVGMMVEEYLQGRPSLPYGDYVSVESLCAPDRITHVSVSGKFPMAPPFREQGQFWPSALPPEDAAAVADLTTRALRALGVDFGVTHTEVKLTAQGPRIIEVNGRLGGLVNEISRRAAGVDLIRLAGLRAAGKDDWAEPEPMDRVHFQYWGAGPAERCRLTGVRGGREARAVPGITAYRPIVKPGQWLFDGGMTCQLDMVCGEAASHREMFAVLDEALGRITYDFRFEDGHTVSVAPPRPWSAAGDTASPQV
ncbi:ATP-grasp domain-containing protein [Streptomyces sp. NRRL B-24484]|uniref:ATP-grasp domain-containing protein n=1 Tax=Streptomyces sp. NRRL B-24484 TaxID=1463833 RepID=UPI0005BE19D3|nr:ATP-grasp domain-containing protein [Streptomyces sp. NRRL B-24484]